MTAELKSFTRLFATCLALHAIAASPVIAQNPQPKLAVPDDAAQKPALAVVADVYKPDYENAKTPAQKLELAKKLLGEGVATKDDPVSRFVLFRIARDIAVQQGDLVTAFDAIGRIGTEYDADRMQMKVDAATLAVKALKLPKDHQACAVVLAPLIDEAIAVDRYDHAKSLASLTLGCARGGRDAERIKQMTSKTIVIEAIAAEFERVKEAKVTLEAKPTDPDANLAVGKFLCLFKGDWQRGVPMLALGSNEEFNATAMLELEEKPDALKLGDGWWKIAEGLEGTAKLRVQAHSAEWYRNALPGLSGLSKTRVERLVSQVTKDSNYYLIAASEKPETPTSQNMSPGTIKTVTPPLESPLLSIPKLLVAPFDAAAAKEAQQAWAKQLRTEVQITNSVGMKLVLIPAGVFTMGSPKDEVGRSANEEQVEVTVSKSYFLGQTEVTQGQWNVVMGTDPWKGQQYVKEGANYPATYVSWNDATEFCKKLSTKEGKPYRLPTESEWEYACRGGTTTAYSFGRNATNLSDYGWCNKNAWDIGHKYAHQVGEKKANLFGLYDMHGNVWEWCEDIHAAKLAGGRDPVVSAGSRSRVLRGGSWDNDSDGTRSAVRTYISPGSRRPSQGFRICVALSGNPGTRSIQNEDIGPPVIVAPVPPPIQRPPEASPLPMPKSLVAPFDTTEVKEAQQAWAKYLKTEVKITNSVGMKLTLIPAGEFEMGSPTTEPKRRRNESSLQVRIKSPFYLGVYEVTQGEYKQARGLNPSMFAKGSSKSPSPILIDDTSRFPVESVSWYDAVDFCNKLSRKDRFTDYYKLANVKYDKGSIQSADVEVLGGLGYRLPTEAEWEYACRAGTTTPFQFGTALNGEQANVDGRYPYGKTINGTFLKRTAQAGSYTTANAFDLFDMHGNVWEWCADVYRENSTGSSIDPLGPTTGNSRVVRGGSWYLSSDCARAAYRNDFSPEVRDAYIGFRISRTP